MEQRDDARHDSRLKAAFLSYRLNLPSEDESRVLLTVEDWEAVLSRPVGSDDGRPIVGLDLGQGRAWSSAVAVWRSGRVEAVAICAGLPSIELQEKRDQVNPGSYQKLVDAGKLIIAEGLRVPKPAALVALAKRWNPMYMLADRFRLPELQDAVNGVPILSQVNDWKHGSLNVRALRKMAFDGPLSVSMDSRALLTASLSVARVENDSSGNVKLKKRDEFNNKSRDDVAAALLLAAGKLSRLPGDRPRGFLAQ